MLTQNIDCHSTIILLIYNTNINYIILNMENKSRQYSLARNYHDNLGIKNVQNRYLYKPTLGALPQIIREESNSMNTIEENNKNIFRLNEEKRMRNIDIENDKTYEYVGIRQIKAYQKKIEKKRRNVNSIKRSTQSVISLSRISNVKSSDDHRYLTKDQVLRIFSPPNELSKNMKECQQAREEYLTIDCNDKAKTTQNTSLATLTQHNSMANVSHRHHVSQGVSIDKIKKYYNKYSNCWKKQIEQRRNKKESQFGSILKSIDNYRKQQETRQKYTLNELIHNIQPKLWSKILRTDQKLQQYYDKKQIQVIQRNKICVKGKNKLNKQINWIEEKDKMGYFFKKQNVKKLDQHSFVSRRRRKV